MCILMVIAMSSIALAAEDPVQPNAPRNNVSPASEPHLQSLAWPADPEGAGAMEGGKQTDSGIITTLCWSCS